MCIYIYVYVYVYVNVCVCVCVNMIYVFMHTHAALLQGKKCAYVIVCVYGMQWKMERDM